MDWGSWGAGLLGKGIEGIFGTLFGDLNNRRSYEYYQKGLKEQFKYNEQAANNADARQRAMFSDLYSPQAQLQQLKAAGLSPSLMFANGVGGQGLTAPQGGGVSGLPETYGASSGDLANMALVAAQTRKINAEADTIEGVNVRGKNEIANQLVQMGLTKAATEYTKSQNLAQQLANYITDNTKEFTINQARSQAELTATTAMRAVYESIVAQNEAQWSSETLEERIKSVALENKNLHTKDLLMRSNIRLNDAQINQIDAEIQKWSAEVGIDYCNMLVNLKNANTQAEFVNGIKSYWDRVADNLENRLEFDKSKFDREMRYKWTEFITTTALEQLNYFGDKTLEMVTGGLLKSTKPISGLQ